jgi:hypothetical protein
LNSPQGEDIEKQAEGISEGNPFLIAFSKRRRKIKEDDDAQTRDAQKKGR